MSAGRHAFKLTDTARLIKAAVTAGLTVRGVTTNREGRPVVITGDRSIDGDLPDVPPNPWGEPGKSDAT